MSTPKISSVNQDNVRAFLQFILNGSKVGQTFFRRVEKVIGHDFISASKIQTPHLPVVKISQHEFEKLPKSVVDKNVQVKFRTFHGFTKFNSVRDEPDCVRGRPIFFHSKNFRQFDLTHDMSFNFSSDKRLNNHSTPMEGDLLFVFLSNQTIDSLEKGISVSKLPNADMWFIASEQFLRAYTAILYDWHETFDLMTNVPMDAPRDIKEEALKYKLFSGNKLMTNSWAKYHLSHEAEGKLVSQQDSIDKFWNLRTEYSSKRWVDIWCALVLAARYGELPCHQNVPNNKAGPQRVSWDIPKNLVSKLVKYALCSENIPSDFVTDYENYDFSDTPFMKMTAPIVQVDNVEQKEICNNAPQSITQNFQHFQPETDDSWASKIRKSLAVNQK
jgi:hypothetical protein